MRLLFDGESIGARLDKHRGWTHGFDYLRISLALSVISWHTLYSCYGDFGGLPILTSWGRGFINLILPMFFTIGGFLVTASLLRSRSIAEFLLLRILRIWPGLLGVIAVSALVIGPMVTSTSLRGYFFQPEFFDYWLSALGDIQYKLPGVFDDNPASSIINISLWTIPWEFGCCVALCALVIFKGLQRPRILITAGIALSVLIPLLAFLMHDEFTLFERPPGHLLIMCFIPGVLFYFLRYQIPVNFNLFLVALVAALILLLKAKTSYFAPFFIAYVTVYLGLLHPPKFGFFKNCDYSYGIYLYGFLVQQTVVYLLPHYRMWWINKLISLPGATICAIASWHLIEGPILKRKKAFLNAMNGHLSIDFRTNTRSVLK